jgi:hypothetical protein
MILALSESFRKLLSLRVLPSSMALNCLWPEGAAVTKRSDPHDFIFIMEITIYFRGRWNVILRCHVGRCPRSLRHQGEQPVLTRVLLNPNTTL